MEHDVFEFLGQRGLPLHRAVVPELMPSAVSARFGSSGLAIPIHSKVELSSAVGDSSGPPVQGIVPRRGELIDPIESSTI
jgi:hypothetical protein